MTAPRRFPKATVAGLARAKILGVRAGAEHRYTGVWVVVVGGRAFVRSWNDEPTGWYRALRAEPLWSIQLAGRRSPSAPAEPGASDAGTPSRGPTRRSTPPRRPRTGCVV